MKLTLVLLATLAVCGWSLDASGQALNPNKHLLGDSIGGHWHLDPAAKSTIETATLTFKDGDGRPALTVDFVARYAAGGRPRSAPTVVDMIVTELSPDDDRPAMQMRVDDEPLPLTGRLRTRRSIVATMPFDDFIKLTQAARIVEQAFGTELEFGAGQLRMLRSIAEKWSRR